ncbi:MAG TPA: cyclic nucleotide-binding domain-containing protein [Polyangia bacterium]
MPDEDLLLSDVERRVALRQLTAFRMLGDDALGAIARLSRRRELAPGSTTVVEPGHERMAVSLLGGDLHVSRMGRPSRVAEESHVLGMYWLARDSMPLELYTERGAVVLEFPGDRLDEVLEEHFPVWLATTQGVASWLLDLAPVSPLQTAERRAESVVTRLTERIAALQEAMPFARGYVDALMQLDEEAVTVRYEPGEVIWRAGDAADGVLVVLDGALRGVTADEPSGIGSLELFAGRPRATALEAVEPTTALRIGKELLYDLVEDHHELARDLLAMIAASVVHLLE